MRTIVILVSLVATPALAQELYCPTTGRVGGKSNHVYEIARDAHAPVVAARDGTVSFVGSHQQGKESVILEHGHGVTTVYEAPGRVKVRKGEHVLEGQVIFGHGATLQFSVESHGRRVALPFFVGEPLLAGGAIQGSFGLKTEGPRQPPVGHGHVVSLSYFDGVGQTNVVNALEHTKLGQHVETYAGSYGVNGGTSDALHAAHSRYAPIFEVVKDSYPSRDLTAAEARLVRDHAHAGTLPAYTSILGMSYSSAYGWGREKGRRMRDDVRKTVRQGALVESWHLDELVSEVMGPDQDAILGYVGGLLDGLHGGRAELGDRPMKGILFVAANAFGIASSSGSHVRTFLGIAWRTCFRICGEEYPDFTGDPVAVASSEAGLQVGLRNAGFPGRYMACVTPGERLVAGLGGNVNGLSLAQVQSWEERYVDKRRQDGVESFAEYNFVHENEPSSVVEEATAVMAHAVR
ncbi:MAG TPA: M23 family metallopeptidase [Planctomycetota bacterium]|nr:M23 family metallopeptidase [Planctomycetota bacterium]